MTSRTTIEPITDPDEDAASLIEDVVERPHHLRSEWIIRQGWTTVPMESAYHFYEREAEWLSEAAIASGHNECLAVPTEDFNPALPCYRVPMTQEGLLDFSWTCTGLNYVLIPEDRFFVVLCASDSYFIVAGPTDFVRKAIGTSIETARKMFLRYADDRLWPESDRRHLVDVAKRYAKYPEE